MAIRIRCQVLKTIAAIGPCTTKEVGEALPHLTKQQIRTNCARLNNNDDALKVVGEKTNERGGRPFKIYQVRDDDEIKNPIKENKARSTTNTYSNQLQRPMHYDKAKRRIVIRHMDEKIKLLEVMIKYVSDTRLDLLIGIINDLKMG